MLFDPKAFVWEKLQQPHWGRGFRALSIQELLWATREGSPGQQPWWTGKGPEEGVKRACRPVVWSEGQRVGDCLGESGRRLDGTDLGCGDCARSECGRP